MTTISEGTYPADLVLFEEDKFYSRDAVTIANGQGVLGIGTVLGQVTASKEFVVHDPAAGDGSETVAGVLLNPVDATSAAVPAVRLKRHAQIRRAALTYHASITTEAQRDTVADGLEALGITAQKDA